MVNILFDSLRSSVNNLNIRSLVKSPQNILWNQVANESHTLTTKLQELGGIAVDLGLLRNEDLNFLRGFGRTFNYNNPAQRVEDLNRVPVPNVYLTTSVNGRKYELWMYGSEEEFSFTDTVNWEENSIVGRPQELFAYSSSVSTRFTINGHLTINSEEEEQEYERHLLAIQAMKYPVRFGTGVGAPPLWGFVFFDQYRNNIIIGPLLIRVLGVNWSFKAPYLSTGKPTVTKVSLEVAKVEEDITSSSQVTYENKITGATRDRYFEDVINNRTVGG